MQCAYCTYRVNEDGHGPLMPAVTEVRGTPVCADHVEVAMDYDGGGTGDMSIVRPIKVPVTKPQGPWTDPQPPAMEQQ